MKESCHHRLEGVPQVKPFFNVVWVTFPCQCSGGPKLKIFSIESFPSKCLSSAVPTCFMYMCKNPSTSVNLGMKKKSCKHSLDKKKFAYLFKTSVFIYIDKDELRFSLSLVGSLVVIICILRRPWTWKCFNSELLMTAAPFETLFGDLERVRPSLSQYQQKPLRTPIVK